MAYFPHTRRSSWFKSVGTTAGGVDIATLKGAALGSGTNWLKLTPQYATDDIRYSVGETPSATVGGKLDANTPPFSAADCATLKLIAITAAANVTGDEF
jgi:hypothetical protein